MINRVLDWFLGVPGPGCTNCSFVADDWEIVRQHYQKEHWTPTYYRADWAVDQAWERNS